MHPPPLMIADYVAPAIAAVIFVLAMSFLREPVRRDVNAVIVTGATGVYLSGGGFGPWELVFPLIAVPIAYRGFRDYRFIGIVWLMHSGWDLAHHLWGHPLWPFMPTSSFGCMIFDAGIALWFLAGAPAIVPLGVRRTSPNTASTKEVSS